MSNYDLYRNTICKDNDNDYIILFKDEESAKIVFDELNEKDQRIAELWEELEKYKNEFHHMCMVEEKLKNKIKLLKEKEINNMENKEFDVDKLINEIYNEFSWVFADNKKYIKLVNIIQKNINELQEENERLKTELAEKDKQLQNAVFPKFKINYIV